MDYLILEIHFLHSATDTGQHLIRDGVQHIAENGDRQMVSEDFYCITLLTGDVRHVYQGNIHADIAHIGCPLSVDQTIAGSPS